MSKTYSLTYNLYESYHQGSATYQNARIVLSFTVPDSTTISSSTAKTPSISYSMSLQVKKLVAETYLNSGSHDWYFNATVNVYSNNVKLDTRAIYGSIYSKSATLGTSWVTIKTATGTMPASSAFNTSSLFTSSNKTAKTSAISISVSYAEVTADDGTVVADRSVESSKVNSGAVFTLNTPPTVTNGTPTYSDPQYAGYGEYSVDVTRAVAQYSGEIRSITLTVGSNSLTRNYSATTVTNQTFSVVPQTAGTPTPTLTVTDSRTLSKTVSLPQITVNPYNAPAVNFNVFRVNDNALRDDQGHLCLIDANILYTDAIATLTEPSVKIDGIDIAQQTGASIAWYTNWDNTSGVSGAISDWSALTPTNSRVHVYGLIDWDYDVTGKFAEDKSYQITVQETDSNGKISTAISQTMSTAFYTIDFQAGGKEIAFGAPANDTLTTHQEDVGLFKCGMEAQFNEAVHAQANEVFIDGTIDPTQTPTDYIIDRLQIIDANGDRVASFHAEQTPSTDKTGAGFNANRIVNGTNIINGMMFHIDSNGTRTVYLNYPQAFRDALGISDYVVEEGTSTDGRSRWRKWNSGRAEFWYHYNVSGVTTAVWTAPIYYMDTSTFSSIWNGVFNGSPFSVHCDSNSSQFISVTAYAWNSSGITSLRYLSVGAKSNNNVPTSIYAVGTWK